MRHLRLGCALAALIVPAVVAQAQETTSAIRGSVVNEQSQAVAGATVTIIHTPSGTRVTQTSGGNGEFNATGLRLGGPYAITVEAPGFDPVTETVEGLTAGTPQRIEVMLAAAGQTITVSAARQRSSISVSSGPATVLNAEAIAGVATVSRDIRNLAGRSPYVSLDPTNGRGAISILGQNNRFNRFTVDGIQFGDPFGLEAGGLASARGPVPLDAIGEFSVEVTPVDIQQGFFQGGAINAQLKSGGNDFTATGFFTAIPESFSASTTRGGARVPARPESRNFGVQFTGPIIKDKLFFAVTWERLRDRTPAQVDAATLNITQAQVDRIKDIASNVYDFEAGDVANDISERDDKVVAKIDWNIADGHRAAFTYIYSEGNILAGQTGAGEPNATNPTLSLFSNNYDQGAINHYGVFQLNDQWTDNFSTQLRVSYNDYLRLQVPFNGRDFGQFQVCLAEPATLGNVQPPCAANTRRIQFGPDVSRQANELAVQTWGVEFQAQLKLNNHSVKFIAERRVQDFNNLFAQNVSGNWRFDSIEDLIARRANQLILSVPTSGNIDSVRAIFNSTVNTFGLQDVWDVTDNLTLTAGFRWDIYETPDVPVFNQAFQDRNGFANNATLNGRTLFQPRASLVWRANDRLNIRAAAGLYGGGNPNVWISNNYSNPGPLLGTATLIRNPNGTFTLNGVTATPAQIAALGPAVLNNVSGGTGVPQEFRDLVSTGGNTLAVTNALDPNFRIPSQWRVSGTVDYEANLGFLGDGWNFGGDVIWSRVKDAINYVDLRARTNTADSTLPDGRPRYIGVPANTGQNTDLLLTNTDLGYSWNLIARFDKKWDNGLFLNGAYTWQRAKDVNPGTSSVAASNYGQAASLDPNTAAYGTSIYQVDDAYRLNFGFDGTIFGDNKTRIELFFNSRAGQRFSYTIADLTPNRSAVFGTAGTNNRYLMYVPNVASITADPNVVYATGFDFAGFQQFIQNSPLARYQGQIAPKNIGRAPRFNKLDLSIRQELPFVFGGKFEVFGDIENVLNLLNRDWGSLRQVAFPNFGTVANVSCAGGNTTCPQLQYATFRRPAETLFINQSIWQARIGARVKF
jgi:hypothetical protein